MTILGSHGCPAVGGVQPGCHAVIDTGDGPHTVLITSPGTDGGGGGGGETVVPTDSPLGRALLGARVGDRVRVRSAAGPRMARVIAIRRRSSWLRAPAGG